ncbi:MAG TPA: potassium channel family protein [Sphingobacteriaceae bacterium]
MRDAKLSRERNQLLKNITSFLEGPMIFLGFVWLILLIVELTGSSNKTLEIAGTVIWIIFVTDFGVKFFLAPHKIPFLKNNFLTAISLVIPALRLFRAFRFFRFLALVKGSRLIKVLASFNRSMKSLNQTMRRRGFGYVMVLTMAVILAGAAGMFAFESKEGTLDSYAESLWWTTMLVMTVGSDYWPKTSEGRVLCILIGVYGFAVFGYITATLASFFVGRDAEEKTGALAGTADIEQLRNEIRSLTRSLAEKNKS